MNVFKTIILGALLALSGTAGAQQTIYAPMGVESNANAGAVSGSESASGSYAAGGHGGSASANNHGNRLAVVSYGSDLSRAHKNTPSVVAPSIQTGSLTDSCLGAASGGVAGAGFGISAGKSYVDKHCVRRLHAKFLASAGQGELAMAIMCEDEFVSEASAAMAARKGVVDLCTGQMPPVEEVAKADDIDDVFK